MFVEIAFPIIILVAFFGFSKIQFIRKPVEVPFDITAYPAQSLLYDGPKYKQFGNPKSGVTPVYQTP